MKKPKLDIYEVGRLAGVSKSTVSRVISDTGGSVSRKAKDAVNAAISELGYTRNTFAAGLRNSKSYLALLVVPDIANPFWSEIVRAVQDRLEPEGYSVVVGNTDWSEERELSYLRLFRTGRFDGLIINSVTDDIDLILEAGIPAVLVGERSELTQIDTVGTATYQAATLALQYLYDAGHRRIAVVTSETGSERFLSRRFTAYTDFMEAKGLAKDPDLVFTAHLSAEGGERLAGDILAVPGWKDRISAVLCGNDILAISLQNTLRARGVEPGRDISVIGMDDIPIAALTWPALTTIRKPRAEMGKKAAELLMKRIGDPSRTPEKHLYPGTLVIRDSVVEIRN
ncbi:MAG: LacI family DNA-binding transcriptional regulator [Spirochaetes bacterium]|nr:LacI family DNA-binding transcriptional regulator [Spirochaetota bacterium]